MNDKQSEAAHLAIDEDMTIYNAGAQKETLLAALEEANRLEVDLSRVGDMDTAGLQLLLMVKREATRENKDVVFVGHSSAVQHLIEFCNLAGVFGDPMVISASAA